MAQHRGQEGDGGDFGQAKANNIAMKMITGGELDDALPFPLAPPPDPPHSTLCGSAKLLL